VLDAKSMNKRQNFVVWLDGYFDAVGDEDFNINKTNVIKNKLNDLFEHAAKPVEVQVSLEELGEQHGFSVQQGFPNSHQGLGRDEDGGVYRC